MKTITRFALLLAAGLFAAGTLSAQTLQWAYTNYYGVFDEAGDGHGGYAICEWGTGPNELSARCVWLTPEGTVQLTNNVELQSETTQMHIVRLNPTELAIQFYPRLLPGESPKSLLRRFQKKGNKIVTSDTELDPYDALPQVSQMTDSLGFFAINTTTFRQVRRYSN